MIGAVALTLSACGRKGPLDPPPGGQVLERSTLLRTPVTNTGAPRPVEEQPKPQVEYDEDGRPIAPPGPRKHSPADWLLN
jgi:predicted small lipoprotein YifL